MLIPEKLTGNEQYDCCLLVAPKTLGDGNTLQTSFKETEAKSGMDGMQKWFSIFELLRR